jgi:hypothetical protein
MKIDRVFPEPPFSDPDGPQAPEPPHLDELEAAKSALILQAEALVAQGAEHLARPLYAEAARQELVLAEKYEEADRGDDAAVSRLSAASCLVAAQQFADAKPILQGLRDLFPDAEEMLAQCEGRENGPLWAPAPELDALVGLLVKRKLINAEEWADALAAAQQ